MREVLSDESASVWGGDVDGEARRVAAVVSVGGHGARWLVDWFEVRLDWIVFLLRRLQLGSFDMLIMLLSLRVVDESLSLLLVGSLLVDCWMWVLELCEISDDRGQDMRYLYVFEMLQVAVGRHCTSFKRMDNP